MFVISDNNAVSGVSDALDFCCDLSNALRDGIIDNSMCSRTRVR